jgi:hypothetical protein
MRVRLVPVEPGVDGLARADFDLSAGAAVSDGAGLRRIDQLTPGMSADQFGTWAAVQPQRARARAGRPLRRVLNASLSQRTGPWPPRAASPASTTSRSAAPI